MQMLLVLLGSFWLFWAFEASFTEKNVPIVGGHPEHVRVAFNPDPVTPMAFLQKDWRIQTTHSIKSNQIQSNQVELAGAQRIGVVLLVAKTWSLINWDPFSKMTVSRFVPQTVETNLSSAKWREKALEPGNPWWRLTCYVTIAHELMLGTETLVSQNLQVDKECQSRDSAITKNHSAPSLACAAAAWSRGACRLKMTSCRLSWWGWEKNSLLPFLWVLFAVPYPCGSSHPHITVEVDRVP